MPSFAMIGTITSPAAGSSPFRSGQRKTVDLIAGVLKEAGEGGNNASSSRLLHAGKNNPKKPRRMALSD
jgi:hypothetical protein